MGTLYSPAGRAWGPPQFFLPLSQMPFRKLSGKGGGEGGVRMEEEEEEQAETEEEHEKSEGKGPVRGGEVWELDWEDE